MSSPRPRLLRPISGAGHVDPVIHRQRFKVAHPEAWSFRQQRAAGGPCCLLA